MTANACNDRHQGNRRICASIFEGRQRDLLRVKGGIADYCMVGEMDVQALRRFPSSYRSPAKPFKPFKPFKPVLDGFEVDFGRKVLPAGEKE